MAPVLDRPIVFATPYYPPFGAGGAEYTTSIHARLLVQAGHRVVVYTPNYGAPECETRDGVEVRRYPLGVQLALGQQVPASVLYGFAHARALARLIHSDFVERAPLLIHAQHAYSAIGVSAAAKVLSVPFVAHCRDTTMLCSHGAVCLMESGISRTPATCGPVQHGCCAATRARPKDASSGLRAAAAVHSILPYWHFQRRRRAYRSAARVAFASAGLADLHRGLVDFPAPDLFHVVYAAAEIPVSPSTIAPPDAVVALRAKEVPIILHVGKLSRGKGADILAEAHRLLLQTHPNAQLVLAGVEHDDWGFDEANTHFLGFVARERIEPLYRAADVVCAPASWPEPLGWSSLDAGRYGRPIVATAVGGVPEAVEDRVNGLLVPPRQPTSLAKALGWILDNPVEAQAMGARGLQKIANTFGPEAVGRQLQALYAGLW